MFALMRQANFDLSHTRIKQILQHTITDVSKGVSNPCSSDASDRDGLDLASGLWCS
ncbi:hypothetical protein [Pseudanabaena sp. FACHB-2040]|uniref:hypothetical protein n=1 Tax=Pseudanabaena sp. FACHB-2040 TaxID=2692859 RepID=UPI00321FA776